MRYAYIRKTKWLVEFKEIIALLEQQGTHKYIV
jgi:hypothetical protein